MLHFVRFGKKGLIRMLLYIGVCGQKFNAIVARVGMWVTMRATESERKGLVRGLVKGWQAVGKTLFLFHGLSMLYQCSYQCLPLMECRVIHISTLKKRKGKTEIWKQWK